MASLFRPRNDQPAGNRGRQPGGKSDRLPAAQGKSQNIAVEHQWLSDELSCGRFAWNGHEQALADSLAVYALLARLDSALSTANPFVFRNGT